MKYYNFSNLIRSDFGTSNRYSYYNNSEYNSSPFRRFYDSVESINSPRSNNIFNRSRINYDNNNRNRDFYYRDNDCCDNNFRDFDRDFDDINFRDRDRDRDDRDCRRRDDDWGWPDFWYEP